MEAKPCAKCGGEFTEWVEFCPHCSEPVEGYARPAGFWIGVGAYLIDTLVFIPLIARVPIGHIDAGLGPGQARTVSASRRHVGRLLLRLQRPPGLNHLG